MSENSRMSERPEPGLTFEVFSLFPEAIRSFLAGGLIGKALSDGVVAVHCTDYRDFTRDRHRTVDDSPYGGGAGMVMKAGPVVDALDSVTAARGPMHRILVTPSAPRFDQRVAERLAQLPRIGLLCGRYEGIDDRVREAHVDECLSIGDFVLNGGEVAALTIIEAVARLREGVLGNPESVVGESFTLADRGPWLEHPHYTRPLNFRGQEVPAVLLSGDHSAIARWRAEEACRRTWSLRPDLRGTPALAKGRPIYLALVGGVEGVGGDLLNETRRAFDLPLALIGPGRSAPTGMPPEIVSRDLKDLRRRLRRLHGLRPQIVGLVADPNPGDPEQSPDPVDPVDSEVLREPSLLLELLAIRGEGEPLRPLVLLVAADGERPRGLDAYFAPLLSSPDQERLELAQTAQMIESSQPKSATSIDTLIAAAIRRLRPRSS